MFAFRSIRTKVLAFTSTLIVFTVGALIAVSVWLDRKGSSDVRQVNEALMRDAIETEWEQKGRMLAMLLAHKLVQPLYILDISERNRLIQAAIKERYIQYVYVQDEQGTVL